ncbi:MAG: CapA family protein [Negativibacillus sp.]
MRLKHFFACLLAVALLCGCTPRTAEVQTPPVQSPPKPEQAEPTSPPQPPAPPTHATLLAVGDNLIHDVIYWQAKTDDGYDFFPAYQAVAPLIQQADLSFINQETPVVAENPPASYPLFNSPVQLADSLQQLGFDIVNLANNHMLDQHAAGLQSTLSLMQEHFEPQGAVIGVNGAVPVVERNGIRFGFAAFTQHTNGIPLPQDKQEMITYTDQTERMQQQIEQLEQTADLTVVSVHWGEENSTTPTDYQRELAQQLTEWGADLIIGTHPHVLQPVEEITSPNGNRATVLYSLGNFISAQADRANLVGAIAQIEVEKDPSTEKITIHPPQLQPVVTCYQAGMRNCTCFPFATTPGSLPTNAGSRFPATTSASWFPRSSTLPF